MASVLIYGLVNSVVLALAAVGFSLTYGISRIANFAHGALYVLAGLLAWFFVHRLESNYILALGGAVLVTGVAGIALYKVVLWRVRGMPVAEVIVTFALGAALLELLRFLGFLGADFSIPPFSTRTVEIAGVPLDAQRILLVFVGLGLLLALWWFRHHSRLGLALGAIAQDEEAAMLMGVNTERAAAIAVGLGAALAGIAAVVTLPLGFIAAESGAGVLLSAVAVSIVGGLGSPVGTLVASLLLGYAQIVTVALFGPHFQMIVALLAILLTLILRPSGLFGQQKALEERV